MEKLTPILAVIDPSDEPLQVAGKAPLVDETLPAYVAAETATAHPG
jgi:hypothetical protein